MRQQEDIRSQIARIRLITKRLVETSLTGDYCSAFKGVGLEFDQLREYQLGDDVRTIDWNSVAKTDRLMVKQFIQERDRTVIIVLDRSSSLRFSSTDATREQLITELAASLAWIANFSKDRVGLLCVGAEIERWIPPARGNAHIARIIEAICTPYQKDTQTNLVAALEFLIQLKKRHAIVFMLSDWIETNERMLKLLKVARIEYDFVAVRLLDALEKDFPALGLWQLQDVETGRSMLVDAADFARRAAQRVIEQQKLFSRHKIDLLDFTVGMPWIKPLIGFFHQRMRRQI